MYKGLAVWECVWQSTCVLTISKITIKSVGPLLAISYHYHVRKFKAKTVSELSPRFRRCCNPCQVWLKSLPVSTERNNFHHNGMHKVVKFNNKMITKNYDRGCAITNFLILSSTNLYHWFSCRVLYLNLDNIKSLQWLFNEKPCFQEWDAMNK